MGGSIVFTCCMAEVVESLGHSIVHKSRPLPITAARGAKGVEGVGRGLGNPKATGPLWERAIELQLELFETQQCFQKLRLAVGGGGVLLTVRFGQSVSQVSATQS